MATGFSLRDAAPIDGEVTVISADRVTDARTGRSYFKAEIALVGDRQGGALLRRLGPGMPVQVIVPTQARTAFDYLVGPLRQSFRRGVAGVVRVGALSCWLGMDGDLSTKWIHHKGRKALRTNQWLRRIVAMRLSGPVIGMASKSVGRACAT